MRIYRIWILILLVCMFCCIGCRRKVSDTDIVGKWIYEINLPEKETGLKDINEASIEFFSDKTFKTLNIPAVTFEPPPGHTKLIDWGGKGAAISGSGRWEIYKSSEGQEEIMLYFFEIRGEERKISCNIFINRLPFGKILSLYYEYDSTLCIFDKVKPVKKQ